MKELLEQIAKALKRFAAIGILLVPVASQATNFKAIDMLNGNFSVLISNNTTYTFGFTNIVYTNKLGVSVESFNVTNGMFPNTNALTGYITYTNAPYNTWVNWTNVSPAGAAGPAWVDAPIQSDVNGNVLPTSIGLIVNANTGGGTNTIVFTFAPLHRQWTPQYNTNNQISGSGYTSIAATSVNDVFATSVLITNGINQCYLTNLPTAFAQGAWGVRCLTIAVNNNSSTNAYYDLRSMSVNQFQP